MGNTGTRRADIQGLRAVAVGVVVLFHGGGIIPGGFTGVDVFFVISGFVITGLLLRERDRYGRISFTRFYQRRILRLAPSAAVMSLVTLLLSYLFVSPFRQDQVGRAALATPLFMSNFYFALFTDGYFQQSSTFNPFLHTWSLAVEEQFYLIFPLLVFLFAIHFSRRTGYRQLAIAIVVLSALSFLLCVWLTGAPLLGNGRWLVKLAQLSPSLAFYTPFTRAWEFGVGALVQMLAMGGSGAAPRSLRAVRAVEIISILLLVGSFALLSEHDFPGWKAALPVLGTLGLIWAYTVRSHQRASLVRAMLESRPMQWIGDRSYTWYLWHWPCVVIAMSILPGRWWVATLGGLASILPAMVAFKFVEHPIHSIPRFRMPVRFAITALLAFSLPIAGSLVFIKGSEAAWGDHKLATWRRQAGERHIDRLDGCFGSWPVGDPARAHCVWPAKNSRGRILFVGDSHAGHLSEAAIAAINELGFDAEIATFGNCPFVIRSSNFIPGCAGYMSASMSFLRKSPGHYSAIVVSNAAAGYVREATNDAPIEQQLPAAREWARDSVATASILQQIAPTLVVLDTPSAEEFPECLRPNAFQSPAEECGNAPTASKAVRRRDQVVSLEKEVLAGRGLAYYDPRALICDAVTCRALLPDGRLRYSDSSHLTIAASTEFIGPLRESMQTVLR